MQNRLKYRISRNLQLCSETGTGTGTRNSTFKIWPVLKHPLQPPGSATGHMSVNCIVSPNSDRISILSSN